MALPRADASPETVLPKARKRLSPTRRADMFWGYFMIAPVLLGLCIFYIWPALQTFYLSFTEWGAFGKYEWSGTQNYQRLVYDQEVWQALRNTLVYTALSVPISIALSIIVAVLLNQQIRGVGVYRTLYFLPAVTMPAAVAMVWQWLFNGDYGLINYLLSLASIQGPRWLSHPNIALYSVVVVGIWSSIGFNMVIFLAGLQAIPRSYYEAAVIDGAGPMVQFWRITLPLLTPTIFFATVISLITAFQVFDIIYLMIGSNSSVIDNTQSVVYLFFEHAFPLGNKGYAATIAVVLFVIILAVTILQLRLQRRWVHYA